jgi:hypothetical protein
MANDIDRRNGLRAAGPRRAPAKRSQQEPRSEEIVD